MSKKKKYIKSNSSLNYIKKGVHVNNYPGFDIYKFRNCALFFLKSAFLRFTQILSDIVPNLDPKAEESVGDWMLHF